MNNQPKLTYEEIITIRALSTYNPSVFSGGKLAGYFNVTRGNIWKVTSGMIWKRVPFPSKEDAHIIAIGFLDEVYK